MPPRRFPDVTTARPLNMDPKRDEVAKKNSSYCKKGVDVNDKLQKMNQFEMAKVCNEINGKIEISQSFRYSLF